MRDGLQLYLRRARIISRTTVTLTGITSPTAGHLVRLRYPSTPKARQISCPNCCHIFDETRPPTCSVFYDPRCRIRIGADISMNVVAICHIQRKVHIHSSSQSVRTFQMGRSAPRQHWDNSDYQQFWQIISPSVYESGSSTISSESADKGSFRKV